ncbi:Ssh4p [Lachancea thermotolerans CBS 6340]|uniref:KLTH0D04994p n=1 Tax=Lachancea thermotolerans (strain ATCC 56472 / CBS 6340 / NRRL Y-8284) TaxID=559295 RepID=C5DGF9_LACTC|nr:KLTH0D04994p [Lachancea thermotolerans CBS 6340]CAR22501.1 KLTH0D04994p [Lachancea thermotolerans CBS 6340]
MQKLSAYSPTGFQISGDPLFDPPIGDHQDGEAISLVFLISLSVTFAVLMLMLIIVAVYVTFCSTDESEYDEEVASALPNLFKKKRSGVLLDGSFLTPGQYDDEQALLEQEAQELPRMSTFEVELYQRCREFQKMCPPIVKEFGTYTNINDKQFIKDRGIQSYYFLPSINDNVDQYGNFLPSFIVQDKLDVTFTKFNRSSSAVMNYPLPHNKKDAVYFEVKVFKYPAKSNSIFSCGLVTCPYPYFRMPGMAQFSIAYESTGKLRMNNPFYANTLLPKLQEGDVIGFGYRYKTGTILITHNGKKLMDLTHNVGIDLFIGIGAMNAAYTRSYTREGLMEDCDNVSLRERILASDMDQKAPRAIHEQLENVHDSHDEDLASDEIELQVNLGQLGFVYVEANVKKYAFGSVYGEIGVPPAYNGDEIKKDVVLQKGEDLPPMYPTEELAPLAETTVTIREGEPSSKDLEEYENRSSTFDREDGAEEVRPLKPRSNKKKNRKKNRKRGAKRGFK